MFHNHSWNPRNGRSPGGNHWLENILLICIVLMICLLAYQAFNNQGRRHKARFSSAGTSVEEVKLLFNAR